MRILVTGSRDWRDFKVIADAIYQVVTEWRCKPGDVTIVHGGCKTGADEEANWLAELVGIKVEIHPADWKKHGKAAGPIRNQEMVDAGADICLAFIKNNSRGATHCADAAEKAGIPVRRYTA